MFAQLSGRITVDRPWVCWSCSVSLSRVPWSAVRRLNTQECTADWSGACGRVAEGRAGATACDVRGMDRFADGSGDPWVPAGSTRAGLLSVVLSSGTGSPCRILGEVSRRANFAAVGESVADRVV